MKPTTKRHAVAAAILLAAVVSLCLLWLFVGWMIDAFGQNYIFGAILSVMFFAAIYAMILDDLKRRANP